MGNRQLGSFDQETTLEPLDEFLLWDTSEGALNNVTAREFRSDIRDNERWMPLSSTYIGAFSSASRILSGNTSKFSVGMPIRYEDSSGTKYYGIVHAISTNVYIDIAGADVPDPVSNVAIGRPEGVRTIKWFIDGAFATAQNEYNKGNDTNGLGITWWEAPSAYLVHFTAAQATADGGAQEAVINPSKNGGTRIADTGVTLGAAGATVEHGLGEINSSNYNVPRTTRLDFDVTTSSSTPGTPQDLTITLILVYE